MPADTIIALACIGAAFAFFAGVLVFGDMTWSKAGNATRSRKDALPRDRA